jgi:hypothetical protein
LEPLVDRFKQRRVVLAFKRIKESVTYAVIASSISKIIEDYNIKEKVDFVVTDGGLNFTKAFR